MKLDTDPFPVGMVELMDKKVLVHTDQAEMTKGKNVVVSDELRNQMAEGQTLAQIVQGNNGDLDALQATLVQIFSDLPNADELDLEQSTADWLGVAQ